MKNHIIIQDWAGNILFKGHYKDKEVDQVLDANRCACRFENDEKDLSSQGDCLECDNTGYWGDF